MLKLGVSLRRSREIALLSFAMNETDFSVSGTITK